MKYDTFEDKLLVDYRRGNIKEKDGYPVKEYCSHLMDDYILNENGELICSKCEDYNLIN